MGFLFGGPKPPAIPVAPPAATPATLANPAVQSAGTDQSKRAAGAMLDSTNKTGSQGVLTAPTTAQSTLLGG